MIATPRSLPVLRRRSPKQEENQLRSILIDMSQQERAIALSFLAAILADTEQPSSSSPLVLRFMMYGNRVNKERQIKLANLLTRLLADPNLLHR